MRRAMTLVESSTYHLSPASFPALKEEQPLHLDMEHGAVSLILSILALAEKRCYQMQLVKLPVRRQLSFM
jgi:hypothetical protein